MVDSINTGINVNTFRIKSISNFDLTNLANGSILQYNSSTNMWVPISKLPIEFGGTNSTTTATARTALGVPPTSHATSATTYGISSATNYGHAMASSVTPLVAGTASVGAETSKFARGNHVHPAQTSVTGNAGTATKLATARTIALSGGATGTATSFNGSANISIPVTALDESKLSSAVAIARGGTGSTTAAGALTNLGLTATATELNYTDGVTSNIQTQLNAKAPTSHATSATTYGISSATNYGHAMASSVTPLVAGTATLGSETAKFARGDHVHPVQTSVTGSSGSCTGNSSTATTLATARTIALSGGATGTATSFNGSANISIPVTSLDESKLSSAVAIVRGGTGATTATGALTNLGLTATATELNYTDGVTSNIQTQLNAKAPTSHATSATTYGVASATNYGHAMASSATPLVAGTASIGTDDGKFARGNHVHPVQTSVSGNAGTATKLATSKTIALSGGATGTATAFDGSDNISIPITAIDSSYLVGIISSSNLPTVTFQQLVTVDDDTARYALTTAEVNNGYTVRVLSTSKLFLVIDDTNLDNGSGYSEYTSVSIPSEHADINTVYGASSATKYGHSKASSTVPLVAGVASLGSETASFARGDHVHPAQSLSGNAETATVLATPRTIGISGGATGTPTSFDGSSNITIPITALDESALSSAVAISRGGTGATTAAGALTNLGLTATATELNYTDGVTSNIQTQIDSKASTNHASISNAYGAASDTVYGHVLASSTTPLLAGTASVGTEIFKFARGNHVHPAQTSVTGNAGTATKLATARTIALSGGATGTATSFNGSDNITIPVTALDESKLSSAVAIARGGTGATTAAGALSNLGITATSTELNYTDGVTSSIQTQLNGKSPTSHASTATTYGVSSATNYGHAMASSVTPLVAGTATLGSETAKFARGDHVHPVQTSVSGNAGTATTLATSRTIALSGGAKGTATSFNGSANITIPVTALDESKLSSAVAIARGGTGATTVDSARNNLNASTGYKVTYTTSTTAGWYRIATSAVGIVNCIGIFNISGYVSGSNALATIVSSISYGTNPVIGQLQYASYSSASFTKARLVYNTTYSGNYAYIEIYKPSTSAVTLNIDVMGHLGWSLLSSSTLGKIPTGYTSEEITFELGGPSSSSGWGN